MSRGPIAAAIDAVLTGAVAPSLAHRGFRRRRRTWRRETDGVVAVVTGQAHRFNAGRTGLLTLDVGVSYPGLGEAPPPRPGAAAQCAHWVRIGQVSGSGVDLWWQIDDVGDPADVSRVTGEVREVWERDGLALVDVLDDPRRFLEVAFAPRAYGRTVGLTEVDLLVRLGETGLARQVVEAELARLLADSQREPTAQHPHPRLSLPLRYAWLLPLLDLLGQPLPDEHQHVVRASLAEARARPDALALPSSGLAGELLRELERRVGSPAPP